MGQSKFLTTRQRQVAELMTRGYSTKKIAARLCISIRTVESHRAAIWEALGFNTMDELYKYINPTPVVVVLTSHPENTSVVIGEEVLRLFNETH